MKFSGFMGHIWDMAALPAPEGHGTLEKTKKTAAHTAPRREEKKMEKQEAERKARHWEKRLLAFVHWLLLGAGIGAVIGGGVGSAFYWVLQQVTALRGDYPWLLYLLPAAGVLIQGMYRLCGVKESRGTNLVLLAVRSPQQLPVRMAPLIFVGTALTHLCGGSAGREGAALQIGGSLGYSLGRLLHRDEKERHVLTMCGMGSVFAALFGTPVAAAVFALEVVSVGEMYYPALVPTVLACVTASGIAQLLGAQPTHFDVSGIAPVGLLPGLQVLALSALCALVAAGFCLALRWVGKGMHKFLPNPYVRALVGAAIVIVFNLVSGTTDYEGAGTDVIARAVAGEAVPQAFLWKILLTALTLGAGFKGGEIVPTFFIGATFGCFAGELLGLSPGFGAAVGLVALFAGVTNCPVSALLLGCSIFGFEGAPYYLLAAAISYALSGYTGLYSAQKILYSKFRPAFIDKPLDGSDHTA